MPPARVHLFPFALAIVAAAAAAAAAAFASLAADLLPGFTPAPHFAEQVRTFTFEPEVRVHINAAAPDLFAATRPVRLIIYALPNGNTIEQTAGRRLAPGDDWHFDIQHIAAQTRRLREVIEDETIVVAYVEAGGLSWPAWRKKNPDNAAIIARLVDTLRGEFSGYSVTVDLAAHSGGGSFLFGFINHYERIPDWVHRIAFLDANYGYSDADGHGGKILDWLQRGSDHFFGVIAYDDRNIEVNGKKVVGPDGGTYRRTMDTLARLGRDLTLCETVVPIGDPPPPGERREAPEGAPVRVYRRFRALGGRADIIVHENPDNRILHTVLVEVNGLIHAMTFATKYEGKAGEFRAARAYEKWIAPE